MKSFFLSMLTVLCVSFATAQRPIRIEIKVPQMNCEECEAIIENALWKRVDGIVEIDAKWRAKKVVIKYIEDRIDSANIKLRIAELGFDASDEMADEEKMKRLPKCCQKLVKPAVVQPASPMPPTPPVKPVLQPDSSKKGGVVPVNSKPKIPVKAATSPNKVKPAATKPAQKKS